MAGYVAITTENWISCIRENACKSAVFWCKKSNFKAISLGEKFYFLKKGKFSSNADRYISGYGRFVKFEKRSSESLWEAYGTAVGFPSEEEFLLQVQSIYKEDKCDLGCIILDNLTFFRRERSLQECKVDFSPYIVSGKKITDDESARIDEEE